jgi:hypothetical protein
MQKHASASVRGTTRTTLVEQGTAVEQHAILEPEASVRHEANAHDR